MANDTLTLPDDTSNTGKKLDTESLSVAGTTVNRERNQVAGAADDDIAVVTDSAPGASDHGLVTREAARGSATSANSIPVVVASDQAAVPVTDDGGSLTVDGTITASNTAGDVAHDSADSGNPVKVGTRASNYDDVSATAVAAADRTDLLGDRYGILFAITGHPRTQTISATYTASQTDTAIITAGASERIVVTRISVMLDAATTQSEVAYVIGFGASTTPTTTDCISNHGGLSPGSGVVEGNGGGILGAGALGEDLRINCGGPTGGDLRVTVSYFLSV